MSNLYSFVSPQAGLLSENPLAALPLQQSINMLGEMPQGITLLQWSICAIRPSFDIIRMFFVIGSQGH